MHMQVVSIPDCTAWLDPAGVDVVVPVDRPHQKPLPSATANCEVMHCQFQYLLRAEKEAIHVFEVETELAADGAAVKTLRLTPLHQFTPRLECTVHTMVTHCSKLLIHVVRKIDQMSYESHVLVFNVTSPDCDEWSEVAASPPISGFPTIALSADETTVVTAHQDDIEHQHKINVWNGETFENRLCVTLPDYVSSLVISPDGETIFAMGQTKLDRYFREDPLRSFGNRRMQNSMSASHALSRAPMIEGEVRAVLPPIPSANPPDAETVIRVLRISTTARAVTHQVFPCCLGMDSATGLLSNPSCTELYVTGSRPTRLPGFIVDNYTMVLRADTLDRDRDLPGFVFAKSPDGVALIALCGAAVSVLTSSTGEHRDWREG